MEPELFTITLSDGTVIDNLHLNGNNFISDTELTEKDFDGKLEHVTIECSDGTVETLYNADLVQVVEFEPGEWWFILRELTQEELYRMQLDADRDMILDLLSEQEYQLCMIDLGLN